MRHAIPIVLALSALAGCDTRSAPETDAGTASGLDASTPGPRCDDGRARCGDACVDVATDPDHCGGCGVSCGADQLCAGGRCGAPPATCPPEGCPTGSYCDLASDRCVAGCLSDAECSAGRICEARRCIAGCRTDAACSETQTCSGDTCVGCPGGRGNCDRSAADACETDLSSDDAHCGACGNACGAGRACVAGRCRCDGGATECGGSCVDTESDVRHCGACGAACPTPAHGTATCEGGSCAARCDAGYHLCGGVCVADASVATCGSSCTACPTPAHGSATCDGTSCGVTCDAGYVACDEGCCEHCASAGCSGFTWCDTTTGLCEYGCSRHDQCSSGFFCLASTHDCARTTDSGCPSGYTYRGSCSSGTSFCVHSGLPSGTEYVFASPCPSGTTQRGSFYCSDVTRVCVPD